jgi:hypothetical protein
MSTQYTLVGSFDKALSRGEAEETADEAQEGKEREQEDDGEEECKDPMAAGPGEVYLDITCIEMGIHFDRFQRRQEAFRQVFGEVRNSIEKQYDWQGALAFDSYIHLLKAFASKIGNAITGFQATCIGLFTVQIGHFKFKSQHTIALSLFEGFLRFCFSFYGDWQHCFPGWQNTYSYRQCAIDLTLGGRWLPRMTSSWPTELYFWSAEGNMRTRPDERVNVTHSLDPGRVAVEALALWNRAFSEKGNRLPLGIAFAGGSH